jgi:hypothetical protein
MRKIIFTLFFVALTFGAAAQKNLSLGLKSGFMTNYKDMQYGFDAAYQWGSAIELALTGAFNPNISLESGTLGNYSTDKLSLYSANLDLRFYLLQQEFWGTGPALGFQYLSVKNKTIDYGDYNIPGFNIGWHGRVFITDNVQINGGWRWTNAKEKMKNQDGSYDRGYHFFYLGLAYTFDLR